MSKVLHIIITKLEKYSDYLRINTSQELMSKVLFLPNRKNIQID